MTVNWKTKIDTSCVTAKTNIGIKRKMGHVIQSISIRENRFGFEPEITAKIAKMKIPIYKVGISYYGWTYEEGKKSAGKTALEQFGAL